MTTPLVTGDEMRRIDTLTIEDAGIPGLVLMENAGRAAAQICRQAYEDGEEGLVVIFCGKGNNGGDGMVVARVLHGWGWDVCCVLVAAREQVLGDALTQLDIVDTLGIEVLEVHDAWPETVNALLNEAVLVVDALFGTGLKADVRGLPLEAIRKINESGCPVISVDLPSGIHADTGAVLSEAVIADVTVTFALQKRGLIASPGSEHAGGVVTVDIGIPPEVIDHVAPAAFLSDDMQAPFLPARLPNSHKGTFGHVLVIGGSPGRGGATLLAGMAALRSGAGLVSVLSDARCQPALEGRYPELMVDAGWSPAAVSSEKIAAALSEKSVVIVGPGLAVDSDGWCVLEAVLKNVTCPLVLDAGALSLIAQHPDCLRELAVDYVLTPHPGEAARLLGTSSGAIQANRFDAAQQLQRLTGGVVVLKGARTLTVDQDAQLYVNQTGNAGLATAGTGDVLCGIIAAFLARGLPLADGSRAAVHVHGEAGDRLVARLGQESLIASDLLEAIPGVLNGDEPDA